jgi:hypothetical protein
MNLLHSFYCLSPACADQLPCQFHTCPTVCPSTRTLYWLSPVLRSSAITSSYPPTVLLYTLATWFTVSRVETTCYSFRSLFTLLIVIHGQVCPPTHKTRR